jgi:hypothetical protein
MRDVIVVDAEQWGNRVDEQQRGDNASDDELE